MNRYSYYLITSVLILLFGFKASAQDQLDVTGEAFDYEENQLHVIDGLILRDLKDYVRFNLRYSEIIKIDTLTDEKALFKYDSLGDKGVVILYTSTPIILDGTLLIDEAEKFKALSEVMPWQIKKIERMRKNQLNRTFKVKSSGVVVTTY